VDVSAALKCFIINRIHGGESGIRTHAHSMASITCRDYIAPDAKFPTLATHHCTLLPAGGKIFCSQLSLRQRAIAFELTVRSQPPKLPAFPKP